MLISVDLSVLLNDVLISCLCDRANSETTASAWTASLSLSAIPWATWWGRWLVWCMPLASRSFSWALDSIMGI